MYLPNKNRPHGFTIIELVTVIVIMGILAGYLVTHLGYTDWSHKTQAAALRSHLRYAQSRAMKSGSDWGIHCDGTQYWLFTGSDPNLASAREPLPGETTVLVNLNDKKVTIAAFTIIFDSHGIPFTATGVRLADGANTSITVTALSNSSRTADVNITPETGFVP